MTVDRVAQLFRNYRRTLRPVAALATIAIFIALITTGLLTSRDTTPVINGHSDIALYKRIISQVRAGQSYYTVTIREHRDDNYPLRPFVAVRLPTHAWVMAALPNDLACRLVLAGVGVAALVAWALCLTRLNIDPLSYGCTLVILLSGIGVAFVPNAYQMHEVWAGLLIALSMALRKPGRWRASLLIGTGAALFRELAAPYLLVMAFIALKERRLQEAVAWFAGFVVFAIALTAHAAIVDGLVTASDPISPGWLSFGGWNFVLETAKWNLLLLVGGSWLTAILVPLALLGLTALREPLDLRLSLTVVGYIVGFLFVGRANNSYWGLIVAPLLPLGLITAWPALSKCISDILSIFQNRPSMTLKSNSQYTNDIASGLHS
jgi:hypothetical protein